MFVHGTEMLICSVIPGRMVTGYGVKGGRGRCYTLWADYMACLASHDSNSLKVCTNEREDYMECIHHVKLASYAVCVLCVCVCTRKCIACVHACICGI